MSRISNKFFIALLVFICTFQTGCKNNYSEITETDFSMDTYVSVTVYKESDHEIAKEAIKLCKELEKILSKTSPEGDIKKLEENRYKYVEISAHTLEILNKYREFYPISEEKLDCTVGSLTNLWDFSGENNQPPSHTDIESSTYGIGLDFINIKDGAAMLSSDSACLDFGAIAKGYISQEIKNFLIEKDVKNALLNFGGNIVTIGTKPDGTNYTIGIQNPTENHSKAIKAVSVNDKAVITAGVYERSFEYNGALYHHILDPHTGYSVKSDLVSATIICDDATLGDAYSTICILLGKDKAIKLINETENVEAILITADNEIITSENATDYIKEN